MGFLLQKVGNPLESRIEGFYSTLFLPPKKNGQMRPVITVHDPVDGVRVGMGEYPLLGVCEVP